MLYHEPFVHGAVLYLEQEFKRLHDMIRAQADRIASQSYLLGCKAENPHAQQTESRHEEAEGTNG